MPCTGIHAFRILCELAGTPHHFPVLAAQMFWLLRDQVLGIAAIPSASRLRKVITHGQQWRSAIPHPGPQVCDATSPSALSNSRRFEPGTAVFYHNSNLARCHS